MNRTKIFVDAHVFDGIPQGTTTYIKGIYNSLVKSKDFECVLAANDLKSLKTHFPDPSFNFATLSSKSKYKRLIFDIPRLIRDSKSDFAHFQYILPLKKKCKEIVTIHDVLFLDFPDLFPVGYRLSKDFLFKRSAKRADLLVTVSDYSKEALSKYYRIDPDKIIVTPNGIFKDYTNSSTSGVLPDIREKYGIDKYILYVSRIEPRKNHLGLLRAYTELQLYKKNYSLVFIGNIDIFPKKLKLFYEHLPEKEKEKILFIKNASELELKAFYKNCSLFVYPSFAEGFGIPPLEAVSVGATTLCSNSTAMSEFTFLGDKLFNPFDLNEMKEKISFFLNNPVSQERIKDEQQKILKKYNWDHSADIFINSIRAIL